MSSNSLGKHFTITTFGESHGPFIGVVIDGCPAGLEILKEEIQKDLDLRRPGKNALTSPRNELDLVQIISGVYENHSTGAPITLLIPNQDQSPQAYESIKDLIRPGHANYTYLKKYGIFDPYGGGRSSGRETAARVAAGSIAKKLLKHFNIEILAYLHQVSSIIHPLISFEPHLIQMRNASPVYSVDQETQKKMIETIEAVKNEGDSIGGIVRLVTSPLPIGLGDPIYEKLEALLASAMLSIPATKGIEFGEGFKAGQMKGSAHNDLMDETLSFITNHAGGILGGISTGAPLDLKVAFKPTSSIKKSQPTYNWQGEAKTLDLSIKGRHDPCIAIRGVLVVEAMASIVLSDRILSLRLSKLDS